jgi:hypothetical protein
MNNERTRTRELELLSAYLDGELGTTQRQALEARLQHEPNLQDRLENLRKTKIMVGYLPRLRAPRHYTLTPEMVTVRPQKKQPFLGTLRLASALAAILLVVLFGVEFLFTSGPLARPRLGAKPMMEVADVADQAEPLIIWGEPGVGGAEGIVNGLGGDPEIMEEPVMVESMPVEPEAAVEEELPPEDEPELMFEAEALPPTDDEVGILQMPAADEKEMPILGINPEESGEIISRYADTLVEIPQPTWRVIVRILQITMGAILVGGGLAWWLLRRHGLG